MPTLTFEIPKAVVLNSNDRFGWQAKSSRTKKIRELARRATCSAGLLVATPVELTCHVQYARAGRHDAHNLQPTCKALIDGMVDAGLLEDDDDLHVHEVAFRAAVGRSRVGHTTIRIDIKEVA